MRISVVLTAMVVWVSSAFGGTILNENFDELTAQLAVTSAGAFTTIGGTNVDIVGPGDGYGFLCASPESGNCLDMDGSGGNPQGVIESALITLDPGVSYYLSFDLVGSGRGNTTTTSVSFGDYSETFLLETDDTTSGIVTNELITVSSPTTTRLVFTSGTPGNVGAVLDNVSINTSVSVTPEPSTTLMMMLAMLLAGAVMNRRQSKKQS